jgi:trehalose synthase
MQVSRWDRLKDHIGVLRSFVDHVDAATDAHLVLAGPQADSVDDDPEQAAVLGELCAAWDSFGREERRRVHVVTLPMNDEDENGAIVNALQRRSTIVVQKSLAEGFGLTVAEAMWKRRPTVASARGGITAQIEDGKTGVLLRDPTDTAEVGGALTGLLRDRERAAVLATAGHDHVRERFLTSRELTQQLELVEDLVGHAAP